jgi:hypothetical protein
MEIELLEPMRLRAWCTRLQIPDGAVDIMEAMIAEIQADPRLNEIFQQFHEKYAIRGEWTTDWTPLEVDPFVQEKFGPNTSLYYLLAYLSAMPYTEREYNRRGISLEILDHTFLDFSIWMRRAHEMHGDWRFEQFPWMNLHFSMQLYRLGRLQFRLAPYEGHATAFRSKHNGQIVLMCGPGEKLRRDGYAYGAGLKSPSIPSGPDGQPTPEEEAWETVFEESEQGWLGHMVHPLGYAKREACLLEKADWELYLKQGDTILDLHIPRGGPLTPEECRKSFLWASEFFAQYDPGRPYKATFCHTWFFTPQLQQILGPHSNIVRFQREFSLFPYPGGPGFLWGYVFGEKYPDLATCPRDNSMRRAVLDWVENGGELFDLPGLMFHGPDEWGTQPAYQKVDD